VKVKVTIAGISMRFLMTTREAETTIVMKKMAKKKGHGHVDVDLTNNDMVELTNDDPDTDDDDGTKKSEEDDKDDEEAEGENEEEDKQRGGGRRGGR
jgi:hypothetical protein